MRSSSSRWNWPGSSRNRCQPGQGLPRLLGRGDCLQRRPGSENWCSTPPPTLHAPGEDGGGLWQALEEARAFRDSLVHSMSHQIAKQQQQLIQQQHKINVLQQQIQVTRGTQQAEPPGKGTAEQAPPRLDEEAIVLIQFCSDSFHFRSPVLRVTSRWARRCHSGLDGSFGKLSLPCVLCIPTLPRVLGSPTSGQRFGSPVTYSGFLCLQQVNMPYVMIPAFPPSHQPLPVTPDSQLALPIQPIPCKPGE